MLFGLILSIYSAEGFQIKFALYSIDKGAKMKPFLIEKMDPLRRTIDILFISLIYVVSREKLTKYSYKVKNS